jgi:hypothetical protein
MQKGLIEKVVSRNFDAAILESPENVFLEVCSFIVHKCTRKATAYSISYMCCKIQDMLCPYTTLGNFLACY